MRFLGVDLAWGKEQVGKRVHDSGVVALDDSGRVVDASWTSGLRETHAWIEEVSQRDTLLFIDAPLVVKNVSGQRPCERRVGQCYGRWKVSANTTNLGTAGLAGVSLRKRLEKSGWRYDDGAAGPQKSGLVMSECYPYATLVGAHELGFKVERPAYKQRSPTGLTRLEFMHARAATCDHLIAQLNKLRSADPRLDLLSHPETKKLVKQRSPQTKPVEYKRREDLIDAVICAWTAALWWRFGLERCQVLGLVASRRGPHATIIAPFRPEQRGSISSPIS